MQKFDLIIRNGKAILPAQGEQAVDIAISNEQNRCAARARHCCRCGRDARCQGPHDHARRDRRASASRPRQGHQPSARARRCRTGNRRGGERRRDGVHPVPDGDRAVRDDLRGRARRDRSRLAHRFRLSLHHLDRGAARGRAALRDRIRRAELQDLHEQSRRRGLAARSAGHRRRFPAAAVRERRQRAAAWCARIPRRSSLHG